MKTKVTYCSFMQSVTDHPDFNIDFQEGEAQGWSDGYHSCLKEWLADEEERNFNSIVSIVYVFFLIIVLGYVILSLHQ